jgi:hypothetical protein
VIPFIAFLVLLLGGALFFARRAEASVNPSAEDAMPPKQNLTRGERNNNPGNLRSSAVQWRGEKAVQDDPAFESFDTPEDGIRALAIVLLNYQRLHGLRTLRQIISRYAPANENDTEAYIRNVSGATGFLASEPINLQDPDTLRVVVRAVINQENGRVIYPDQQIALAVATAFV